VSAAAAAQPPQRSSLPGVVLAAMSPLPMPPPLAEPDDLTLVRLPCHPYLPLKIAEGYMWTVGCLVCDERHPFAAVRDAGHRGSGKVPGKLDRV